MHDLDRTLGHTRMEAESMFEFASEDEAFQNGRSAEGFVFEAEQGETFDESEVNEFAAELLSVASQQELNQFLGDMIKKAGKAVGKVVGAPLGQQLGGMLKMAAKKALPIAGGIVGNVVAPGIGGAVGSKLGSMANSMFGLELEGLSPEDRQFEAAKQFVRFGGNATQKAVKLAEQGVPTASAATAGVTEASERYLPGLARKSRGAASSANGSLQRGSWERQGNKIVLHLSGA